MFWKAEAWVHEHEALTPPSHHFTSWDLWETSSRTVVFENALVGVCRLGHCCSPKIHILIQGELPKVIWARFWTVGRLWRSGCWKEKRLVGFWYSRWVIGMWCPKRKHRPLVISSSKSSSDAGFARGEIAKRIALEHEMTEWRQRCGSKKAGCVGLSHQSTLLAMAPPFS